MGLAKDMHIKVSAEYSSRTSVGRLLYELHDRPLQPRPGTTMPALRHIHWHTSQVFKGKALGAVG